MQALRSQFLARAALTNDQHRAVNGRQPGDVVQRSGKLGGFANNVWGLWVHG